MASEGKSVNFGGGEPVAQEESESRVIGLRASKARDKRVSRFRSRKASRSKLEKKGSLKKNKLLKVDGEDGDEMPPRKQFPVVEGYLTKLGKKRKNWKRRWVVLENYIMTYYQNEGGKGGKGACGTVDLEEVRKVEDITTPERREAVEREEKNVSGKEHLFLLHTPTRIWYFVSETEKEKKEWIAVIKEQLVEIQTWRIDHRGNPRQYRFLPKDVRDLVEKSKIPCKKMKHTELQVLTNAVRFLKV